MTVDDNYCCLDYHQNTNTRTDKHKHTEDTSTVYTCTCHVYTCTCHVYTCTCNGGVSYYADLQVDMFVHSPPLTRVLPNSQTNQ